MRCLAFAVVALVAAATHAQPPAAPKLAPAGQPIVVELPAESVRVSYCETKYGMRIYLKSGTAEVQGRRLFVGDGKVAVMYQADGNGWDSPDGRVNRAAVEYDKGAVLRVPAARVTRWEQFPGEVYVLAPGLTFEVVPEKK